MNAIELSILIISHNQHSLLPRCVDSVLQQEIPFPHEIIISDDHSTDGTWEVIDAYCTKYPSIIKGYQWECVDLGNTCAIERAGLNRLNAYLHASGKYFVILDGDDYLIGKDIYLKQWSLLEEHPECSMCQHRIMHVKDGEDIKEGFSYFAEIKTGTIYKSSYIVKNPNLIDCNPGIMIRRNPEIDMEKTLGKFFDDRYITYLHLLFGDMIFINEFGYIYVNYQNSICEYGKYDSNLISLKQNADVFTRIQVLPQWAGVFMKSNGIRSVSNIFKYRKSPITLIDNSKWTYKDFDGFVFDFYKKPLKLRTQVDQIRAFVLRWLFFAIKKLHITGGACFYKTLYAMATSRKAANKIPMEYWKIY